MAFLGQEYRAEDLPEGNSFDPVPSGEYIAQIVSSEQKQTKKGGVMLALRFDIFGPTNQGRVVFANINLVNDSEKAQEIGQSQLRKLMLAIGRPTIKDDQELVGGTCKIKVTIQKSEQYGDRNDIKDFKAVEGSQMPKTTGIPKTTPQSTQETNEQKPAAGSAPPWAK